MILYYYLVGTHDLEVKLSKPEIFGTADLLRTLKPALLVSSSIFYFHRNLKILTI